MTQGYKTIRSAVSAEYTEKRSRFVCFASPAPDEGAALALLGDIRAGHRDANHNCYAYALRAPNIQRYSDDGEPTGTAGMPILEVLRHRGIVDALVVVTRYFGGIHLGAGGLVRAYSTGAALALDTAEVLDMRPCTVFSLALPYQNYGKLQHLLGAFGAQVLEDDFSDLVRLRLRILSERFPAFQKDLAELTAGGAAPVVLGEEFAAI